MCQLDNPARASWSRTHLLVIAGDLAVEVEHHVLLLHRLEDGVVDTVVLDTRRRVSGDAAGVRLDALERLARKDCAPVAFYLPRTPALAALWISWGVTSG